MAQVQIFKKKIFLKVNVIMIGPKVSYINTIVIVRMNNKWYQLLYTVQCKWDSHRWCIKYLCTHTHTHISAYIQTYVYIPTACVHIYVWNGYKYKQWYIYIYICTTCIARHSIRSIHTYIYVYMYVYIRIYASIHTRRKVVYYTAMFNANTRESTREYERELSRDSYHVTGLYHVTGVRRDNAYFYVPLTMTRGGH